MNEYTDRLKGGLETAADRAKNTTDQASGGIKDAVGTAGAKVKEEAKATTRNIPFNQPDKEGTCIVCGKPSKRKVYFARAY